MFELLKSIEDYAQKLREKAREVAKIENNFCGTELIAEVGRFFLVFFTAVEIKGIRNNPAPTVALFLENAHDIRERIAERFKKEDVLRQKEQQEELLYHKRPERVVNLYFWVAESFELWVLYPFGDTLEFTELKR